MGRYSRGGGVAARRLGVPGEEERCATGVYDLPCAPMGVPRVWAIKRDHGLPLGEWGTHRDGLVVVWCFDFCPAYTMIKMNTLRILLLLG